MPYPNPVQDGSSLNTHWTKSNPGTPPTLPTQWTATVLLSPFGDTISPLANYSQLVVGTIECDCEPNGDRMMRVRLYNTQDLTYFDFLFVHLQVSQNVVVEDAWYWLDSSPNGPVNNMYGPFRTTLEVPGPTFMADTGAQWGNAYPLMGIDSNHWAVPTPGSSDHGSWYTFRQDTGNLFRIFMMDATNPLMVPIVGSYYIASFPTFTPGAISAETQALAKKIRGGQATAQSNYWNPLVTQEDIQRAMAFPLAKASCTLSDIQAVIPGFVPMPVGVTTPAWNVQTYIEGWSLGADLIPYWTRVCYLWTGGEDSKQQSVFVGFGPNAGQGTYFQRSDTCLDPNGTTPVSYVFPTSGSGNWTPLPCAPLDPQNAGPGLPYPDWLTRDGGVAMAQITGNPNFGLAPGQALNLFAGQLPRGGGALAIFWLWFTGDGNGVLFTEGNYMNPMSHQLQLIDYTLFVQNAGLTQSSFSNPCDWASAKSQRKAAPAHGHPTRIGAR